jgi:hypothetical protein
VSNSGGRHKDVSRYFVDPASGSRDDIQSHSDFFSKPHRSGCLKARMQFSNMYPSADPQRKPCNRGVHILIHHQEAERTFVPSSNVLVEHTQVEVVRKTDDDHAVC